jgi:hypothetical protein
MILKNYKFEFEVAWKPFLNEILMDKMLYLKTWLFKNVEQTNDISQKNKFKTKFLQKKIMTHICVCT